MNDPFNILAPAQPPWNPLAAPGPPLYVAPSSSGYNQVAPTPATLVPLIALSSQMGQWMNRLSSLLRDDIPAAAFYVSRLLAGVRALAGLGDAMAASLAFRPQLDPSIAAKCREFNAKARDLMSAAFASWSDFKMNPRLLIPELDQEIRQLVTAINGALRDSTNIANVQKYTEDESIPEPIRFVNLWSLNTLLAIAVDMVAESGKGEEVDLICQEILASGDESRSVPAIVIKKFKSLWDLYVAAAATAGATVGNLPAPDSLSIALLKVYATVRLPKAAVHQATASRLERELMAYIVKAVKLTPAQEQELRGRVDALKKAQAELIRAKEAQARDAARFGPDGHAARQARKARVRERADNACEEKAKAVGKFYRDVYGPENDALYREFQRTPFLDSFSSVLAIVQLAAAFHELSDPDVSTPQKVADVSTNSLLSLGAVTSTVGRMTAGLDLGATKVTLARLGQIAEKFTSHIALFAGVAAIITGYFQLTEGWQKDEYGDRDWEKVTIGGLTIGSGAAIGFGAACSIFEVGVGVGAVFTGIGAGIGVLLLAYASYRAFVDMTKSDTRKAIESILMGVEKEDYDGKLLMKLLAIQDKVKAVRQAAEAFDGLALIPNPQGGAPTVADLMTLLMDLGFQEEDAKKMIDDPAEPPPMLLIPGY